jgi:hypothetical protein
MLDTLNNWYSITLCDYPEGSYRLTQHANAYDEDAFLNMGINSTIVAEGTKQGLVSIAKSQHLDIWDDKGLIYSEAH